VPVSFGIGVWVASRPTAIEVDSYEIWVNG
jgi:hypothetical protein